MIDSGPLLPTGTGENEFRDEYSRRNLSSVLYALLMTSVVVSLVAIFGPWLQPETRFSVSISCVVYLFLIWLNKKGSSSLAGILTIFTMICIANFGLAIGRGFRDESMLIFPGVIMLSSLIMNRIIYVIVVIIVVINVVVVGILDIRNVFTRGIGETTNPGEIVVASMILLGISLGVYLLINSLFNSARQLKENQYRLRSIFDSSPNGIVVMDFEGNIQQVNRKVRRLFGGTFDEVPSRNFGSLIPESDIKDFSSLIEDLSCGIASDRVFETQLIVGDDRRIPVKIRGWLVVDPDSNRLALGVFLTDMTETHELRDTKSTLEDQLYNMQKIEAIGTLAGGIAHDFNNILVGILGYAELAAAASRHDPVVSDYVGKIGAAGLRAKDLVQQILQFSRHEKGEWGPISLQSVTEEVLKLTESTFPATVGVEASYSEAPVTVRGDGTQVHQVLMNLVTNALHALRDEAGKIEVYLDSVSLEQPRSFLNMKIGPGRYARLRVSDDGMGINKENLERVFEPYYTTKETGEGTGLGLAVTMGIVTNHHGLIEVESALGSGTRFTVYIPELRENENERTLGSEAQHRGNGERILVVDDEEFFVSVIQEFLVSMNYRPTVFNDSIEALEYLKKNHSRYELIISDLTMPGMTGIELIFELTGLGINLPVILCTGFSNDVSEENAESFGISKFLVKPISRSELGEALGEILG